MLISVGIVYGTFWFFEGQELSAGPGVAAVPAGGGPGARAAGPRLQTQPFKDIYLLRQAENEKLRSYGWVDQDAGVVHIPVEDAMTDSERAARLKSAPGAPAGLNQVVEDSFGGAHVRAEVLEGATEPQSLREQVLF